MLEKPDIQDAKIINCLRDEYGLNVSQITFLPLGADQNTVVYQIITDNAVAYFVKLRRGDFDQMTIEIPKFLHDKGIKQIIAPLPTRSHQLWANLADFKLTVSPFITGHNGFESNLTEHHWVEFGHVLNDIHATVVPPVLANRIQQERYSAQWRETVKKFQQLIEETVFSDPIAAELAAFLQDKHDEVSDLIRRADTLATFLQTQSHQLVLCHADIHAGNILIDTTGHLYIVDWDTLILAPKERDLMFIGGGVGGVWYSSHEETLFYQGYGQTQVDPVVFAYYRYERIVQDIVDYCEQILLTNEGSEDRAAGLQELRSQFMPNNVVEIAYRSEKNLPQKYKSQ